VLAGGLVGGLAVAGALTGCLPGSDEEEPKLTREHARRLHLGRIIDDVERLAATYDAVQLRFPDPTGMLVLFAAEHRAHIAALDELIPRPMVASSSGSAPAPARSHQPSVEVTATTPDEARAQLMAEELSASKLRAGEAAEEAPRTARLLASISACNAVHAALLAARPA
jgi:hypothetical protein